MASFRGKHSHKLFKRFERLSQLEDRLILYEEITEEGGVVEGVEP